MADTLRGRIFSGVLANALGKVWIILIQLVCVPFLTWRWGVAGYGEWIMLTAVPTYIAISNFGFGTAAAIEMTRRYAVGDEDGALTAFQSVWALMSALMLAVLGLAFAGWLFSGRLLALFPGVAAPPGIVDAALVMVVYSVATVGMSLVNAGYQCSRRYALGTLLFDVLAPLESAAVVTASLAGGGLLAAALAMTAIRVVGVVAYYLRLRAYEPWFRVGLSHASISVIRRLAHPAMASLSMTLSYALSLEGLTLSLGFLVSPAATAVFATARLLTRFPLQFAGLASRATRPEMSAAHARGDRRVSAMLVLLNLGFTALIVLPAVVVLTIAGPWALGILSRHRLEAGWPLFLWLALTAALQALWDTIGQFLYAINRQQKFTHYYVLLAALIAAAPLFVGRVDVLARVALVWCLAEAAMLVVVVWVWWREDPPDWDALQGAARRVGSYAAAGVRVLSGAPWRPGRQRR